MRLVVERIFRFAAAVNARSDFVGVPIEPVGLAMDWIACAPGGAPPSTGRVEDEYPLQIPGRGHEAPLAAHVFEPAQRELTESERGFDDAEYRFGRLFAQGVERSARWRLSRCAIASTGVGSFGASGAFSNRSLNGG